MSKRSTKKPEAEVNTKAAEEIDRNESEGRSILSRPAFVLLSAAAAVFLIYAVISLIGINAQIRERRLELNELKDEITVQEIKNDEIKRLYDSTGSDFSTLAEQIARDDLDYVKEGERVFVNIAGE